MHELIFLHVGGAGCQIGSELWNLLAREHSINPSDGLFVPEEISADQNNNTDVVFDENSKGVHSSRCLFIDSDPELNYLLNNSVVHKKDNIIKGKESAASNYARAKYSLYNELKEEIENRLRLLMERCDSLQGIMMTHSLAGGTGSGFGEAICSNLDMKQSTISTFTVLPCSKYANEVVASYNVMLANPGIREAVDACFFYDNSSLYNCCQQWYGIEQPNYSDINSLIAYSISNLTSCQRINTSAGGGGGSGKSIKSIYEHLVPFKKINFISNHFSNFQTSDIVNQFKPSEVISNSSRMNNIDMKNGKTLSLNLSMRGPDFSLRNIVELGAYFRSTEGSAIFSKYVQSSAINTSLCKTPPLPTTNQFKLTNTLHVAHNTTAIINSFKEIHKSYEPMYQRRAYVHYFVGEGMESSEFPMVKYNYEELLSDYNELDENPKEI